MEAVMLKFSVFVRITLIYLAVTVALMDAAPLPPRLRARDIVQKIANQEYLLVEQIVSSPKRQWKRSNSAAGSGVLCSSSFETDRDVNRRPQSITKATCKNCASHCRRIMYHHRVLVKSPNNLQTHRTNLTLWKWETVSLPIAFVYDPNH